MINTNGVEKNHHTAKPGEECGSNSDDGAEQFTSIGEENDQKKRCQGGDGEQPNQCLYGHHTFQLRYTLHVYALNVARLNVYRVTRNVQRINGSPLKQIQVFCNDSVTPAVNGYHQGQTDGHFRRSDSKHHHREGLTGNIRWGAIPPECQQINIHGVEH
jgi:hypothetical protein